ncbi:MULTISPECIES: DUF1150 family protein [Roseovarius]|uniref:DUF1150 domain-containing protein n=1 Tax=Roseovarius nubinhibens TaxID=314263 RepID=A0A348WE61_9RHOB|nr:DUF1150 domain-containing protein [Roseovarius nubinhibens]|tara:strand:+ start:1520 stop:1747 length:228 start_codon:yes stop_codon:yes gene_type:complete
MNTPFDFGTEGDRPIAYVRSVEVAELPEEIRVQLDGAKRIYAVHSAAGERLALVRDRGLAFVLARQNDLEPVTVH